MRSERTLAVLQVYGQELSAILTEFEVALGLLGPERLKQLALLRWQLGRALRRYQLYKHVELLEPVIKYGEARSVAHAKVIKQRGVELSESYQAHVERWSSGKVDRHWQLYVDEVQALIAQLQGHVTDESRDLNDLLPVIPASVGGYSAEEVNKRHERV